LESKGSEACALTEAEKLKFSKPKQSRALQVYTLNNKKKGGGGGEEDKTNNRRKALPNETPKARKEVIREKKGETFNVLFILTKAKKVYKK
jgi:hypothetical protein